VSLSARCLRAALILAESEQSRAREALPGVPIAVCFLPEYFEYRIVFPVYISGG